MKKRPCHSGKYKRQSKSKGLLDLSVFSLVTMTSRFYSYQGSENCFSVVSSNVLFSNETLSGEVKGA